MFKRLKLAFQAGPKGIETPPLGLNLHEIASVPSLLANRDPPLDIQPARHPAQVILLPGFLTGPALMMPMRRAMERAGHSVTDWGQGVNLGPNEVNLPALVDRIETLARQSGRPVALVGWSLGGLFAREAAKRAPEAVSLVVTMGSPFSGDRRANNVWRLYQLVTGHAVDHPPGIGDMAVKPSARTVAVWSANDGLIAPASAAGRDGERDRAIEVRARHMLMPLDAETIMAVLAELDREIG